MCRRERIIEHVSTAQTKAEIGKLLLRARELLENLGQGVLVLGVEPTLPMQGLITPRRGRVSSIPGNKGLGGRRRCHWQPKIHAVRK